MIVPKTEIFRTAMILCAVCVCAESTTVSDFLKDVSKGIDTASKVRTFTAETAVPVIEDKTITFIFWLPDEGYTPKRVTLCVRTDKHIKKTVLKKAGKSSVFWAKVKKNTNSRIDYWYETEADGQTTRELDPLNRVIVYANPLVSTIKRVSDGLGSLELIPLLPSESPLIYRRDITIYLPPEYAANPEKRYPVLYMQDGQQLWDSSACAYGGWKMDKVANELIAAGEIEPIIIVGINNSSRRDDELMGWSAYHRVDSVKSNAKADPERILQTAVDFESYVIGTVKPLIDCMYRTKPEAEFTGTGGSSSGAMEALYLGFRNSSTFSKIAALSGGEAYYDDLISEYLPTDRSLKIYLDCGDQNLDAQLLTASVRMRDALVATGYTEGADLQWNLVEGAGHNEAAWAARVPEFLKFLHGIPKGN